MLAEMTAAEYRHWRARQAIRGPFTARRIDYAAAQIAYWVMESQRAKGEPMPFDTFLVDWDAAAAKDHTNPKRQRGRAAHPERQTTAQQIAILQSVQAKLEAREIAKQ